MPNVVSPAVSAASVHADATGDRRDVADHARTDLHHDELGEVEVLVERQEADPENRG